MAFKTVVTSGFAQQLIEFVKDMESANGPFTLAMLVPSESRLSEKWNLVVSAKWIDDDQLQPAIPKITTGLLNHLSNVNARKIERISPFGTKDSFVNDVVAEVEVTPGTAYRVQSFALTLRSIDEAIILAARQPSPSRHRQPQTVKVHG